MTQYEVFEINSVRAFSANDPVLTGIEILPPGHTQHSSTFLSGTDRYHL